MNFEQTCSEKPVEMADDFRQLTKVAFVAKYGSDFYDRLCHTSGIDRDHTVWDDMAKQWVYVGGTIDAGRSVGTPNQSFPTKEEK